MTQKILRIASYNDFSYSDNELRAVKGYQLLGWKVFVNSHASNTIRGNVPCFVTINPNLTELVKPHGRIDLIRAVRVKYVGGAKPKVEKAFLDCIQWAKENNKPVLITYMRWTSKKALEKYSDHPELYEWKRSYYRITKKPVWPDKNIHYCDLAGKGCPTCKNCARLSYNMPDAEIHTVNLSASGICHHNCADCFVKKQLKRTGGKIAFDRIVQNSKMRGKT